MFDLIQALGRFAISHVSRLGRMGVFLCYTLRGLSGLHRKILFTFKQVQFVGSKSLFVISFVAGFSGMVLGLQGYYTLARFGAKGMLGGAVALTLIRELGPVLAALMVAGRAGSAMCAELGIMRIEEQVDALECMAIDPYAYLITPRLVACLISLPLLTALFDVVGIFGGYLVGVGLLGANAGAFMSGMQKIVMWNDVYMGIVKSLCFAVLIIWICTYKGFYAGVDKGSYGPEDVSRATTEAVVLSSVAILVADYVATSFLIK
jgi:phospholipid/cholesterol/gamma-HCH transport system permease protein